MARQTCCSGHCSMERPTPLEVSRSRGSAFVASYYLTRHPRPAYSARPRHTAGLSRKDTFDTNGDECRLAVMILEPRTASHPIRKKTVRYM